MKTIEQVQEYIKKRQNYIQHKQVCKDAYEIENAVGKNQFGTEILNFIEGKVDENT